MAFISSFLNILLSLQSQSFYIRKHNFVLRKQRFRHRFSSRCFFNRRNHIINFIKININILVIKEHAYLVPPCSDFSDSKADFFEKSG